MNRGKIYFFFFLLLLPSHLVAKLGGQARIDSLTKELGGGKYKERDSENTRLLIAIAFEYRLIDPDEGIRYGEKALEQAQQIGWEPGIMNTYDAIGQCYLNMSDYPKALEFEMKGLAIADKLKMSPAKRRKLLGNIGGIYYRQKDYPKTLEFFFASMKVSDETGDKLSAAIARVNISAVYQAIDSLDKALEYLQPAIVYLAEVKNIDGYNNATLNLANIYFSEHKYTLSVETYKKVLESNKTENDPSIWASTYGSMGELYLAAAKDTSAAVKNDKIVQAGKSANLNNATGYLIKGIEYSRRRNDRESIIEYREHLSDVYSMQGNYKEAFDNLRQYTALKDSVFSTDNSVKLAKLETQREKSLKENQEQINKLAERNKQNERLFFIMGFALLLVIVGQVLRNYNKQKRANNMLGTAIKRLEEEQQNSQRLTESLRATVQQKEELATQLVLAAEVKSRFLANISHELRTPVTLFTGMLELMKNRKTAGDAEQLDIAYSNSRKLQSMVEEILDLTKLENGSLARAGGSELVLKKVTKEVAPLLKRIVYTFESHIEKHGLSLEFSATGAEGMCISVDEGLFEKTINNLVYNAVKFTKRGGDIIVTIGLSADDNSAEIRIRDTGLGISQQDLPHIFERYYQGSSTSAADGMGIGLSLVKEFTVLHGGTITVSSTVGTGTEFILKFPVATKNDEEDVAGDVADLPEENWEHLGQPTILLVEDNAEMRYYLREILGKRANLVESGNGKEALAWLENNTPNLIISDIMMPEMDGRTFLTIVKNTNAYKKIPVITLSALASKDNQLGMFRLGIDDYIVKPFNATELRIRVYNLLNNYAERTRFHEQQPEPDDVPADSKEADEFREKITSYVLVGMKNTNLSVYDLAYQLSLSERQLYRLAKSLTGCTPAQLIKEVRLQRAYELLLSGDISKVEDVSKRVGFDNAGYFAKQFLERFGKRPSEFL